MIVLSPAPGKTPQERRSPPATSQAMSQIPTLESANSSHPGVPRDGIFSIVLFCILQKTKKAQQKNTKATHNHNYKKQSRKQQKKQPKQTTQQEESL